MKLEFASDGATGLTRGAAAVLGNLDGVHLGHQALIAEAAAFAARLDAPLAAAVFDPHPRLVFKPDTPPFLLTDLEMKADLLGACGCERVYVLPFSREMAALSPEDFINRYLVDALGLKGVVVGADFRFGKGRGGDAAGLKAHLESKGCEVLIVEPRHADGAADKYSSTEARAALRDGDPQAAAKVLGRPWSVRGVVEEGDKRGRTIGFPTANVSIKGLLEPKFGVYAVEASLQGEDIWRPGVANFGIRPTVGGQVARLETHLFDFNGDIYGKTVEVRLLTFIRPEMKFSGLEELTGQIAKDCVTARAVFDR